MVGSQAPAQSLLIEDAITKGFYLIGPDGEHYKVYDENILDYCVKWMKIAFKGDWLIRMKTNVSPCQHAFSTLHEKGFLTV